MGSLGSDVDTTQLLQQLTLEEKVSLLAGQNFWETVPIERLKIPSLKVSDGPNGARGAQFVGGVTAACFPASTSLASTWDHALAKRIGNALAEETVSKGAYCLLGPTVCPHRSPLGGRNFESFSEDPFLAGTLATTYIKGLQEKGVSATIKHYAANEQETHRFSMNVNVSQRALREIYLKPFEIAIKEAKPWAVMTSYNLVNGTHSDMHEFLLQQVLRKEWGFKGLVMSDWGGTNSVAESITAGLDLEMPGPANLRKFDDVKTALDSGKLKESAIDKCALAVLDFVKITGKFENPETSAEYPLNKPEHRALIREAGAKGIVLLKNEKNILPLKTKELKSVAALGMAKECLAHGGGSASVNCHYRVNPYEALERVLGKDVELRYAQGAQIFRNLPDMVDDLFDLDGKPGLTLSRFGSSDLTQNPFDIKLHTGATYKPMEERSEAAVLEGIFKPSKSGSHYLSFSSMGPANVSIDNKQVFKVTDNSPDAMGFLLGGVVEEQARVVFEAGKEYKLRIESFSPHPDGPKSDLPLLEGLLGHHLGFMLQEAYEEDMLTAAIEAAKGADVALVFVGNTPSWETEGQDMATMSLPANGSQDRLIEAICKVNSKVVVVNSTGVAVNMPWLSSVSAFLQTWFPGQEAGNAIVDVLFGAVNPGGKLPVSFPKSIEDTPSYGNFPGDVQNRQVHYAEGVNIGYRHYDRNPDKVLFPFGFGMSYTQFEIGNVQVLDQELKQGGSVRTQAEVKNTGELAGDEIVQVYIAPLESKVERPIKTLAGYTKVSLAPGESKTVSVEVSAESAAYWDEKSDRWVVEGGEYDLVVGNSSVNIVGKGRCKVASSFTYGP